MTDLLAPLVTVSGQSEAWLSGALLVFLRVGAFMALLPGFGEQSVPMRLRLALTLAFTAVVLPAVSDRLGAGNPILLWGGEIAAGLILGLGLRLMVIALQTAGMIAAQSMSLAQLFAGSSAEPQPAIGHLLTIAGLALAMSAGLHVKAAALMISSYELFPAGALPDSGEAARWGIAAASHSFSLGFALAAPFVLASTLYNLALGAINRAMPQLMVSFIGAPALTAGGLVLLVLSVPPALALWLSAVDAFLANPMAAGG